MYASEGASTHVGRGMSEIAHYVTQGDPRSEVAIALHRASF